MKNLLIYYGWLNSFNSAQHSWNNEKVAQELAKYGLLVFGDGLAASTHGDYSNTKIILPRIKELNPEALIFGYVSVNQTYANFKTKVDEWAHADIDAHGIFLDEAGYDYGTSSTNGRDAFNDKLDYLHSKGMKAFINAWKPEHCLGVENDASYPNTTWNPDEIDSNVMADDWYLLESFAIDSNENYESASQWKSRAEKAREYGVSLAACSVIGDAKSDGQDRMDFIWVSGLMWNLDAVGSSDTLYGASSAKSKMWDRPDGVLSAESGAYVENDSNVYYRYMTDGRYKLDFSSGSEASAIEVF